jgi:hypothetical protein
MVAYNVYRNDERLCVAGVGEFGVLTACVTWVAHSPEKLDRWAAEGIPEQEPAELILQVGGLKSNGNGPASHMRWAEEGLQVGDEIKIHITDASQADTPTTEYRDDPVQELEQKKAYVRRLAKELGWEIRES